MLLAQRGWHAGVIGIVAGRLAEKHDRPVLLVALDNLGTKPGQGSARSAGGFDLVAGLTACRDHLITFGGHAAAAGFRVEEAQLDQLREQLQEVAIDYDWNSLAAGGLLIDAEVPLSALTLKTVQQIERLAPFGQQNPRPLVCASGIRLAEPPKPIGGGRHLALQLLQHGTRIRGVAFGGGERADSLTESDGELAFAFRPIINSFRGKRTVEVHIVDWQRDHPLDEKPLSESSTNLSVNN